MKTLIKTFDILFLLTFILQQVDLKKESSLKLQRKKCNKNEFESIFSRIVVFSEPDRTFPETEAKVPAFCAYDLICLFFLFHLIICNILVKQLILSIDLKITKINASKKQQRILLEF